MTQLECRIADDAQCLDTFWIYSEGLIPPGDTLVELMPSPVNPSHSCKCTCILWDQSQGFCIDGFSGSEVGGIFSFTLELCECVTHHTPVSSFTWMVTSLQ